MTGWLYIQVFLQSFVLIGCALSVLGCLYVAISECLSNRRAHAGLWVFLSFAGLGIALAAGPFMLDSIPTLDGIKYMSGGKSVGTFEAARYAWVIYAAGTLGYIWVYAQRARWFSIVVPSSIAVFCTWVLWVVSEIHG